MRSKMSIRSFQLSLLVIAVAALVGCKKDNSASIATVTTNLTIANITGVSASGGGAVTDDKGETVTARGLCWSTNVNPTTKDSLSKDGSGAGTFTSTMANLQPNTTYYVRAYATNSAGTGYGNAVSFKTTEQPVFPSQGLIAWYPFNANANDESGNGKNGTVYGATLTTDRFGNPNRAFSFNGTTDYILTNALGPSGNSERTVSFWAQVLKSNFDVNSIFCYGGNSAGSFFTVYFLSSTGTFRADVGAATKDYINSSIFNTWHLYTVVLLNNITYIQNALMYMDGKLLTGFTYINQNTYNVNTSKTNPIYIGKSPSYDSVNKYYYNFKGSIDDIGFWNRTLTQDEITTLYNAK